MSIHYAVKQSNMRFRLNVTDIWDVSRSVIQWNAVSDVFTYNTLSNNPTVCSSFKNILSNWTFALCHRLNDMFILSSMKVTTSQMEIPTLSCVHVYVCVCVCVCMCVVCIWIAIVITSMMLSVVHACVCVHSVICQLYTQQYTVVSTIL